MRRTLALALTSLCALAGTAAAQAPGYYAAPPPPAYGPPPPPAPPPQRANRWGIGLSAGSMDVVNANNEDQTIEMEGGGIHLRYRLGPSVSLELGIDGFEGEVADFRRQSASGTLSLFYHLTPYSKWNWYLLGGLGSTHDAIYYGGRTDDAEPDEEFVEHHLHLGLGLERRWNQLGIGAELRGVALGRDDNELDGQRYNGLDGPVPYESTAGQFKLHATFYF